MKNIPDEKIVQIGARKTREIWLACEGNGLV
jgi:hypothetical protein